MRTQNRAWPCSTVSDQQYMAHVAWGHAPRKIFSAAWATWPERRRELRLDFPTGAAGVRRGPHVTMKPILIWRTNS